MIARNNTTGLKLSDAVARVAEFTGASTVAIYASQTRTELAANLDALLKTLHTRTGWTSAREAKCPIWTALTRVTQLTFYIEYRDRIGVEGFRRQCERNREARRMYEDGFRTLRRAIRAAKRAGFVVVSVFDGEEHVAAQGEAQAIEVARSVDDCRVRFARAEEPTKRVAMLLFIGGQGDESVADWTDEPTFDKAISEATAV